MESNGINVTLGAADILNLVYLGASRGHLKLHQ